MANFFTPHCALREGFPLADPDEDRVFCRESGCLTDAELDRDAQSDDRLIDFIWDNCLGGVQLENATLPATKCTESFLGFLAAERSHPNSQQ